MQPPAAAESLFPAEPAVPAPAASRAHRGGRSAGGRWAKRAGASQPPSWGAWRAARRPRRVSAQVARSSPGPVPLPHRPPPAAFPACPPTCWMCGGARPAGGERGGRWAPAAGRVRVPAGALPRGGPCPGGGPAAAPREKPPVAAGAPAAGQRRLGAGAGRALLFQAGVR